MLLFKICVIQRKLTVLYRKIILLLLLLLLLRAQLEAARHVCPRRPNFGAIR